MKPAGELLNKCCCDLEPGLLFLVTNIIKINFYFFTCFDDPQIYHNNILICFIKIVHRLQGTDTTKATPTENRRIPQRFTNETKDDTRPA